MKRRQGLAAVLIVAALLVLAAAAWAATTDGPELRWSVIGSGGAPASAGAITLNSSLGQPISSGGAGAPGTQLQPGFWPGASKEEHTLFLPAVMQ